MNRFEEMYKILCERQVKVPAYYSEVTLKLNSRDKFLLSIGIEVKHTDRHDHPHYAFIRCTLTATPYETRAA
jgi:hypothetical protein